MRRAIIPSLLVGMVVLGGEARDASLDDEPSLGHTVVVGSYPEGSLGAELDSYELRMDRIRAWYSIMREVQASMDGNERVDFITARSLEVPISSLEDEVVSHPLLAQPLQESGMSARDFALVTVALAVGHAALYMEDSLGPGELPANVSPRLINFFRMHRSELDSLVQGDAQPPD